MSKKDLLDILYAERGRLRDEYTQPGWTNWAILAAMASIVWLLLPYIEEKSFCIQNVSLLVFCFFNVLLVLVIPASVRVKGRAVWKKGGAINRIGAIFFVTLFSAEIAFVLLADCVVINAVAVFAIVMLCIGVLAYLLVFGMSYIACAISTKNNKYNWIWYVLLLPIMIVLAAALVRSWDSLSWDNLRVAMLIGALIVLSMNINVGTREKLKGIDNLIEETLMDENPCEKYVLHRLDECVRGMRVGDFLYKKNAENLIINRKKLIDNLALLKKANDKRDWQCADAIMVESMHMVDYIQTSVELSLKIIKSTFGTKLDEKDQGLIQTVRLLNDCLDVAEVWMGIVKKERVVGDYEAYLNEAMARYGLIINRGK